MAGVKGWRRPPRDHRRGSPMLQQMLKPMPARASQRPRGSRQRLPALRGLAAGLVFLLAVGAALAATAGSDTALDRYLNGMTSLRTDFTQTVTDARGSQTETGAGTLLVQRPGRVRWDYQPRAEPAAATAAAGGTRGN